MATMEDRFNLLMNPPKMMKQTLKRNLDWEYEMALKIRGGMRHGNV